MATGGVDTTVSLWRLLLPPVNQSGASGDVRAGDPRKAGRAAVRPVLTRIKTLCGHDAAVGAVAVSQAYGLVVSGSEDGTVGYSEAGGGEMWRRDMGERSTEERSRGGRERSGGKTHKREAAKRSGGKAVERSGEAERERERVGIGLFK